MLEQGTFAAAAVVAVLPEVAELVVLPALDVGCQLALVPVLEPVPEPKPDVGITYGELLSGFGQQRNVAPTPALVARFAESWRRAIVAAEPPVDEPVAFVTSDFVDPVLVVGEPPRRVHSHKVVHMKPSAAVEHSGVGPPAARVFAASVVSLQFVSATAVVDLASDLEPEATVAVGFAVFESERDPVFESLLLAAATVFVYVSAVGLG